MAAVKTSRSSTKVTPDMPESWRGLPANRRWDLNPNAYNVEYAGTWPVAKMRLSAKRSQAQRAAVVLNNDTGQFEVRVPKAKSK